MRRNRIGAIGLLIVVGLFGLPMTAHADDPLSTPLQSAVQHTEAVRGATNPSVGSVQGPASYTISGSPVVAEVAPVTDSEGSYVAWAMSVNGMIVYGSNVSDLPGPFPAGTSRMWAWNASGIALAVGQPVTITANAACGLIVTVVGAVVADILCPESLGLTCIAGAAAGGYLAAEGCDAPQTQQMTLDGYCNGHISNGALNGKSCNLQGSIYGYQGYVADEWLYFEWIDPSTGLVLESSFCEESFPPGYGTWTGSPVINSCSGISLAQQPQTGTPDSTANWSTVYQDYQPDCPSKSVQITGSVSFTPNGEPTASSAPYYTAVALC